MCIRDRKYPIRSGNGITLGEKFWMPDSGEASFSLIFPLLPPTVKVIDFIESDCEDCFKVWGIHLDGKLPELDLSDDVKKQKLNYDEPLPKAELKDGKSVITGRLLGYLKKFIPLFGIGNNQVKGPKTLPRITIELQGYYGPSVIM